MAHVIDMIADGMGKGMGKDGGKGEGERMKKATLFLSAYPTIPPIQFSCFQMQKYTVGSGMWAEMLSWENSYNFQDVLFFFLSAKCEYYALYHNIQSREEM